jgi:hypothetical protein
MAPSLFPVIDAVQELIDCPICGRAFSSAIIERHAATCFNADSLEIAEVETDDLSLEAEVSTRSAGVSFSTHRETIRSQSGGNPSRVTPPAVDSMVYTEVPRLRRGVVVAVGNFGEWPAAGLTVRWEDNRTSVVRWGVPKDGRGGDVGGMCSFLVRVSWAVLRASKRHVLSSVA